MTERLLLLKGRQICVTGLSRTEEEITKERIESLGGKFSKDLFNRTFCVIVKKVGSQKCVVARNLNIPLVRLEWLQDCINNQSIQPMENYAVRTFTGLKFGLSGFSPDEFYVTDADKQIEQQILNTVISLGGEVYNELMDDTFCVLLKRVGSSMYQEALTRNIPCVDLQWLTDCHNNLLLLPLSDYLVKPLTGLSVSFTGFTAEHLKKGKELVTSLGGTNCERMALVDGTRDISNCSHLIAMELKKSEEPSEKILAARRWKAINVVTRGWLNACATEGRWIPEISFLHKANIKQSVAAEQDAKAKLLKR